MPTSGPHDDGGELRLAALAAALYALGGVQVAFFPIWLSARGLSGAEIATILAACPAVRIASNLAGTQLGDRYGNFGGLILRFSAAALMIFIVLGFTRGFVELLIGVAALSFFQGPVGALNDGLVLGEARRRREAGLHPLRLTMVRSWGAASNLTFMLLSGPVARVLPPDSLIWLMAAIAAAALVSSQVILARFAANVTPEAQRADDDEATLRRPALIALIILATSLIQGSHGFITVFGSLQWMAAGHDADFLSFAWAVAAFADTAFYFAANRWLAAENRAVSFILIGAAGAVARWAILANAPGTAGILLVMAMQPLSGALMMLGPAYLIAELGGRRYTARVHGWLAAANGVALSAALYASGPLEAALGARGYLVMSAMALAGLIIGVVIAGALQTQPLAGMTKTGARAQG